jgi:hypothetical protein
LIVAGLGVAVVAVLTDDTARAALGDAFSFDRPQHMTLYVVCAVVMLVGVPAAVLVGRGRTGAVLLPVVVAAAIGVSFAADENGLNSFPTTRPAGRTLAERAAQDRNGNLSLTWPAFVELRQLVHGVVVVPEGSSWQAYIEHVSELPVRVDPDYDFRLDRDDPRFHGEWLLDRGLRPDFRLVVVGRGIDYRAYFDESLLVLIAEES